MKDGADKQKALPTL